MIVKYRLDGKNAYSELSEFTVLQNNEVGVILVQSFASLNSKNEKELGLFGIVIEKQSLRMTRGNIVLGETDNSIRNGKCIKSAP